PASAGVLMRWLRLVAKTSAVTSAAMPRVEPRTALRTGTTSPRRPALRAILIPVDADTDIPVRAKRAPLDVLTRSGSATRRAIRQAGNHAQETTPATVAARPMGNTNASKANPGAGSAIRASPMGVNHDPRKPNAAATAAPTQPISIAAAIDEPASWRRLIPRPRSVG